MIKTARCWEEPIAAALKADLAALSLDEEMDVEELLQRWGEETFDPRHIYADDTLRYRVLARRLNVSSHLMVAFHDINAQTIVLTAVRNSPHQPAINTAYTYSGRTRNQLPAKPGWQP